MSEKTIDTENRNFVVCPHCGYIDEDTWELNLDEDDGVELECGVCEEKFIAELHLTVEYSTYKIPLTPI